MVGNEERTSKVVGIQLDKSRARESHRPTRDCGIRQTASVRMGAFTPDVMYAGGGSGSGGEGPFTESGVFKTIDAGHKWTSMNQGLADTSVNVLWIDQSNPDILLSGSEFGGLFRSTDGAQSWTRVSPHGPVSALVTIAGGILAGTSQGLGFSDDDGSTWSLLLKTAAAVRCIAVSGSDAIAGLENGEVLWKGPSDQTWRTVASNPQF